jgi:toxin ParE1/3/4
VSKPVSILPSAWDDLGDAYNHYPAAVADRFSRAVNDLFAAIGRNPGSGSPELASQVGIGDLRHRAVRGFPHVVFYRDTATHVRVLRVLRHARDLSFLLRDPTDE